MKYLKLFEEFNEKSYKKFEKVKTENIIHIISNWINYECSKNNITANIYLPSTDDTNEPLYYLNAIVDSLGIRKIIFSNGGDVIKISDEEFIKSRLIIKFKNTVIIKKDYKNVISFSNSDQVNIKYIQDIIQNTDTSYSYDIDINSGSEYMDKFNNLDKFNQVLTTKTIKRNAIKNIKKLKGNLYNKKVFLNLTLEEGLDIIKNSKSNEFKNLKKLLKLGNECVTCKVKPYKFVVTETLQEGKSILSLGLYSENNDLMTIDHIIPKSKGGTNDKNNLQMMCSFCNYEKGNKM